MDWKSSSVLITGGTGSFGKKFVETMLAEYHPKRLAILSRDELKQHEMRQKFPDTGDLPIRYFIGDVRDKDRLYRAFRGVDVVVHAAALKQVPACEYNPFEAVLTNINGAKNIIDAAIDCGVKKVIALSTDKAVNPINLYGATSLPDTGKETRFFVVGTKQIVAFGVFWSAKNASASEKPGFWFSMSGNEVPGYQGGIR